MSLTTRPSAQPADTTATLSGSVALEEMEVALVRWPEERAIRDAMSALGRPRLLLVDPGAQPPEALDLNEDWMRWPPDPAELLLRAQTLGRRIPAPVDDHPLVLDEHGVLHRGDRWVAVSESQVPILELLLEQPDRVVRFDVLAAAYAAAGGSHHPASVRTALSRLDVRLRALGLEIRSIRRRGVVLRSLRR